MQPELEVIHKDQNGALYKSGNTTIEVVAPQIGDEERQCRLNNMERVAWAVWEDVCLSSQKP